MLYLLPILSANMSQPAADFRVVSVDRQETFAGKLGRRVTQTLVAEKDGKRYEIKVGRSHTAIRNSTKTYSAGDVISVGGFDWSTSVKEIN